jgi:ribonuclease E
MAPSGEEAPVIEAEAKPKRRSRAKKPVEAEETAPVEDATPVNEAPAAAEPEAKPKRTRRKTPEPAPSAANDPNGDEVAADEAEAPRRSGWWQRTFGE